MRYVELLLLLMMVVWNVDQFLHARYLYVRCMHLHLHLASRRGVPAMII